MGLVIDTSALVHLDRVKINSKALPFANEDLVLPTIVWAEALIGVRLANSADRAAKRRGLLEQIRLLTSFEPFSAAAAEIYADLYRQLRKEGKNIPQNDLQIAAIAISLGFGGLVGPQDEKHYRQIKNLRVEVIEPEEKAQDPHR